MSIDEFGLGSWWPRPDQAAVGALDHLPVDQWPALAARWLEAGFDSPLLRQLAELRTWDFIGMRLLDLMPEAMERGRGHVPRDERFLAAPRCRRLGLFRAQGGARGRMASLRRPRRSPGYLCLGRRGTRRLHRRRGVVAVHQHGASTRPCRPAQGQDNPNTMSTSPSMPACCRRQLT